MILFVIFLRDLKMTIKKFLGALALGMCAVSANAGVVAVSQTLEIDRYLDGASKNFVFDLNGSLAAQGVRSGDVFAGALTVSGFSGLEAFSLTIGYNGPYLLGQQDRAYQYLGLCGWSLCTKTKTVTDTHYGKDATWTYTDHVKDTMVVTAGGASASDKADDWSSESEASGYVRILTLGSASGGYTTYDLRKVVTEEGYGGDLLAQLTLNAGALADVQDDGLFTFNVKAPGHSQFTVNNARLDLLAVSPVPEPSTWAMIGCALGALVLTRRRSAKDSSERFS